MKKAILATLLMLVLTACSACSNKNLGSANGPGISYIHSETKLMGFYEKIDFVRKFIHYNSRQGDGNYVFPNDQEKAVDDLLIAMRTKNPWSVRWRCYLKSRAMIYILETMGISARSVGVWTDSGSDGDWGHALLEVFNPETKRWEISDPTYNVFFTDSTGIRLGLLEIVSSDLVGIFPCDEKECGWDIEPVDPFPGMDVKHYISNGMFDAAVFNDDVKEVYINENRHDLNFVYPDIGVTLKNFYESEPYNYKVFLVGE